jgi:hypothetical protein
VTVYDDGLVRLICEDAIDDEPAIRSALTDATCLVIDPPFDLPELTEWAADLPRPASTLVFTDPRHLGEVTTLFGPPAWLFVWDTRNTWSAGPRRPVTQTKLCAWFGDLDTYDRDASLWGVPPGRKDHPTTKAEPLAGRRLTDLWSESLRWLHHPGAGQPHAGPTPTARNGDRQGDPWLRHTKPVDWVRCLIGNTSPPGLVVDPFAGYGTTLIAARALGRPAIGWEWDLDAAAAAARRLHDLPPATAAAPTLFGAEP